MERRRKKREEVEEKKEERENTVFSGSFSPSSLSLFLLPLLSLLPLPVLPRHRSAIPKRKTQVCPTVGLFEF